MDFTLLRGRCERAFGSAPPDTVLSRVRAIVGSEAAMPPTEEGRLAVEGYRKLKKGDEPSPFELAALQLLIRMTRPAPLVHNGRADDLQKQEYVEIFPNWPMFQDAATKLRLVCRIDRASATLATAESFGTGVLVARNLVMTNKHVVDDLSRGTGVLEEGQVVVRFDFEDGSFVADSPVAITKAIIHPSLDIALLSLKQAVNIGITLEPLEFDTSPVEANADLIVVGYPLDDKQRNPIFIRNIFGTQFGVLRAAPGQCTGVFGDGFYHDCSTLGGNSGSPVFSMDARLVGIHTGGGFLWKNGAVSSPPLPSFITQHAS